MGGSGRFEGAGEGFAGEEAKEDFDKVTAGQDADEGVIFDHRKAAVAGLLHEVDRVDEGGVRRDGKGLAGHDAADGSIGKDGVVALFGNGDEPGGGATLNVAVGDEANEAAVFNDRKMAHGTGAKGERSVEQQGGRLDSDHGRGHDIANSGRCKRHEASQRGEGDQ